MVTDGLSRTFLLGEKFIPVYYHKKTEKPCLCDDQGMYVGFSYDNNRAGARETPPLPDGMVKVANTEHEVQLRFGSAHPTAFHMACCDGSVHKVNYDIDITIFSAMSTRKGEKRSLYH